MSRASSPMHSVPSLRERPETDDLAVGEVSHVHVSELVNGEAERVGQASGHGDGADGADGAEQDAVPADRRDDPVGVDLSDARVSAVADVDVASIVAADRDGEVEDGLGAGPTVSAEAGRQRRLTGDV